MDPKVLFEDDYLLLLDKPYGLVVNNSHTMKNATLQDFVSKNYAGLFEVSGLSGKDANSKENDIEIDSVNDEYKDAALEDFYSRKGIVHRIDKDTSGVLIVAKEPNTFLYMQKLFKKRKVTKIYYALCFGGEEEQRIEINAPLGRNPKFPFKYAVTTDGREAMTEVERQYSVNVEGIDLTLFKVMPKTGRTHQIRVHLLALNHPIVHDETYCTRNQFAWSQNHFNRMMLHAASVEFVHPKTKELMTVVSELPQDFKKYVK